MDVRTAVLALTSLAAAACSTASASVPADPTKMPGRIDPTWSDPAEYHVERATEEAGEAIFERTGIGDPYRTGLPYPIFLALLEMHPELLGATPRALADRFGFTAREADPKSSDPDVRDGLPLGMHLTDDPNTHIPFLVHNCSMCHSAVVKWSGGEQLVVGMGNRRIRIHAFEDALAKVAASPDFTRIRT